MTDSAIPPAPQVPVPALQGVRKDLNGLVQEGSRVGQLMANGMLQELNFQQVGLLMLELTEAAYNGADGLTHTHGWMQKHEPKVWKKFLAHLQMIRAQNAIAQGKPLQSAPIFTAKKGT